MSSNKSDNLANSPIKNQKELISYIKLKIKEQNKTKIDIVGSNRDDIHLRLRFFNIQEDEEIEVLNRVILNGNYLQKVGKLSDSISNEYTTYVLKLLKNIKEDEKSENIKIPKGTKICFISADPSRKVSSFGKNSSVLKPSKFHFNGKVLSETELNSKTKEAFRNIESVSKLKQEIKQFCMDLMDQVENSPPKNNNGVKIKSEVGNLIEPQDINTIAKNFGEILGALWYMKIDPIEDSVEYPKSDTEQIVDYTIHTNKSGTAYYQRVSAKSKQGAPSSLGGLLSLEKDKIKKITTVNKNKKEFLIEICDKNIEESIIYANFRFNEQLDGRTDAFKELQKIINSIKNVGSNEQPKKIIQNINDYIYKKYIKKSASYRPNNMTQENYMKSLEKPEQLFKDDFSNFFQVCKYSPDISVIKKILNEKKQNKLIDLILFPLGKFAVKKMNDDSELIDLLNLIMKKSGIAQVNINLTNDTVRFNLYNDPRLLNSSRVGFYEYEYNASYTKPKNKGFSFKLKPGK